MRRNQITKRRSSSTKFDDELGAPHETAITNEFDKPVFCYGYGRAPCSARSFCGGAHRQSRPMLPKRRRTWPSGSPVDQLDRMDRRHRRARSDLSHAADISSCDHIRSQSLDSPDFALAQPSCDVGLKNIVGSCRAAAQMTVGHILHDEAEFAEQLLWLPRDALTVLQRTGRVIGDDKAGRFARRFKRQRSEIFSDVLRKARHLAAGSA